MNYLKNLFSTSLTLLLITVVISSDGYGKEKGIESFSTSQIAVLDKQARKTLLLFSKVLFSEMNPQKAIREFCFFGNLTSFEKEGGIQSLFNINRNIPMNIRKRHLASLLSFWSVRAFFILGNKDFSSDISEFDTYFTGSTQLKEKFDEILDRILQKHNLTQAELESFFDDSNKRISLNKLKRVEFFIKDILSSVKNKEINHIIYNKNVTALLKTWEIHKFQLNGKTYYTNVLRATGLAFILGNRNNSLKIIGYPDLID